MTKPEFKLETHTIATLDIFELIWNHVVDKEKAREIYNERILQERNKHFDIDKFAKDFINKYRQDFDNLSKS